MSKNIKQQKRERFKESIRDFVPNRWFGMEIVPAITSGKVGDFAQEKDLNENMEARNVIDLMAKICLEICDKKPYDNIKVQRYRLEIAKILGLQGKTEEIERFLAEARRY